MYSYRIIERFLFFSFYKSNKSFSFLDNKTVLITGASFGIGEACARLMSKAKCRLILIARTEEKLMSLKKELSNCSAEIIIYSIDLREEKSVAFMIEDFREKYGQLDILLLNAGKSIHRSIFDSKDRLHDFKRTMDLNYLSSVQLSLGFLNLLEQSKGQIIHLSALNVLFYSAPKWAAYQSSKVAFDQWMKSVQPELKQKKIQCSILYLPLVRTRMITPTKKYDSYPAMHPRHVATIISGMIKRRKRVFKLWWVAPIELLSFFFGKYFMK